jgi:hypothetical protein
MSRKFLLATGAEFKLLTIWAERWLAAEKITLALPLSSGETDKHPEVQKHQKKHQSNYLTLPDPTPQVTCKSPSVMLAYDTPSLNFDTPTIN